MRWVMNAGNTTSCSENDTIEQSIASASALKVNAQTRIEYGRIMSWRDLLNVSSVPARVPSATRKADCTFLARAALDSWFQIP